MEFMLNGVAIKNVHAQNIGAEQFDFRYDGQLYSIAPGAVVYIPELLHANARREWGGEKFVKLDPRAGSTEYAKSEAQRAKRDADEALEKAKLLLEQADDLRAIAIEKGAIVDAVRASARALPGAEQLRANAGATLPPAPEPEGPPAGLPAGAGPAAPPPADPKPSAKASDAAKK